MLNALTLLNNVFPTGVDAALLARLALEEGLTQDAAIGQMASIIGDKNVMLQQRYGGLIRFTGTRYMTYRAGLGSRSMTQESVEFARNPSKRGVEAGHMLPRKDFDDGVDYEDNFARRGAASKFLLAAQQVADDWEDRVDYDVIERALTTTEVAVGAGYSVPWAIGTGTNVDFIPTNYRGKTFTTAHTHFVYQNSGSGGTWTALLTAIMQELRHHGHSGLLTILVGEDNVDEVAAATGFADLNSPQIIVNTAATGAPVRFMNDQQLVDMQGIPGELIGYFKAVGFGMAEVRYHPRIPSGSTGYAWGFKSYGIDNEKNPLALYIENDRGFGLDIEPDYRATPELKLNRVRVYATHGVGVNDRTNGVAGYIASGASGYVSPTSIS